MAGGFYWFRMVDGEDFIRRLTWYTDATKVTPVDLTSYHASFTIELPDGETIAVTDGHGITLRGASGIIDIEIPSAAFTEATEFSSAKYRLIYTKPNGDLLCLLYGQLTREGQI